MIYDPGFDQTRLNLLARHYLTVGQAVGQVFFFSDSEDNRLDHTRWQVADADFAKLSDSGFKLHLMELLDALLVYRRQHQQPNACHGVVRLDGTQVSIEWLAEADFFAQRDSV